MVALPNSQAAFCRGGGASQKHSTINHLSYPALRWWSSQTVSQSLLWWVCQSEAIQPLTAVYLQGSHPSLSFRCKQLIVVNLATAARGSHKVDAVFFNSNQTKKGKTDNLEKCRISNQWEEYSCTILVVSSFFFWSFMSKSKNVTKIDSDTHLKQKKTRENA